MQKDSSAHNHFSAPIRKFWQALFVVVVTRPSTCTKVFKYCKFLVPKSELYFLDFFVHAVIQAYFSSHKPGGGTNQLK